MSSSQEAPCPTFCWNDGDVDNNGEITPNDGLMAFDIYLMFIPYPTHEENCSADCDGGEMVTPGDAQCILMHYAELDCDCVDPVHTKMRNHSYPRICRPSWKILTEP